MKTIRTRIARLENQTTGETAAQIEADAKDFAARIEEMAERRQPDKVATLSDFKDALMASGCKFLLSTFAHTLAS